MTNKPRITKLERNIIIGGIILLGILLGIFGSFLEEEEKPKYTQSNESIRREIRREKIMKSLENHPDHRFSNKKYYKGY